MVTSGCGLRRALEAPSQSTYLEESSDESEEDIIRGSVSQSAHQQQALSQQHPQPGGHEVTEPRAGFSYVSHAHSSFASDDEEALPGMGMFDD